MVQYIATTIWFVIFGIFVSLFHYPKINAYTHNTKLLRRTIGNYTTNHDVNINENAPHRHREHLLEKLKLKLNLPFDHTVSSTKVGRYDPLNPPQMASWLPFLFKCKFIVWDKGISYENKYPLIQIKQYLTFIIHVRSAPITSQETGTSSS